MGGVQAEHVHAGLHQRVDPVQHVGGGADGGAHQQAALLVAGGGGVYGGLLDVLDGDEALEVVLIVHDGQLLDLVAAQDLLGLLQRDALPGGDQVVPGHHVVHQLAHVGLKLHVAVGDNTDELAVLADGHAGDAVLGHELVGLRQRMAGGQPEGVGDDAVLAALDHVHLLGLGADGHIFMNDADAALTGDGDGHAVLGDGIHGGAHQGDVKPDPAGELGMQIDVCGQDVALGGDEQHVVEGEALPGELLALVSVDHGASPFIFLLSQRLNFFYFTRWLRRCQGVSSASSTAPSNRLLPA